MSRITVDQLWASYGAYLRARVQAVEFESWGPSMTDGFNKTVSEHAELEARYVAQMLADRRSSDQELKSKIDAVDKAHKKR